MSIVLLTIILFVFLLSRWVNAEDFFFNKLIPLWTVPFILIAIYSLLNSDWNQELTYTYQTLFGALNNGLNPYVNNVIYHRLADGSVVYSTFNYLPGEIYPYYIAYLVFGTWNFGVMLLVNLFINLIISYIFIYQIPDVSISTKILYSLLLILTSATHSASLVFLLIMSSGLILLERKDDFSYKYRIILILLMGLGTVAKFFMLPFIFVYFWLNIIEKKYWSYIFDLAGTSIVFLLFTIPFGIWNVLYDAVFFNLNLTARAQVTTYYFNILSGLCYFTNTKFLYGPLVIVLFLGSVILTKKISFQKRILYISLICLLLFPTPEDQFLGCIFGLLLLSKLYDLRIKRTLNVTPQPINS